MLYEVITDEMPLDVQVLQRFLLGYGFLYVILAEGTLAQRMKSPHPAGRVALADCQQRDFTGVSAGFFTGPLDTCTDSVKIFRITSYNVCYTKLLRATGRQRFPGQRRGGRRLLLDP